MLRSRHLRETIAWSVATCALAGAAIVVAADKEQAPKYDAVSRGTRMLESPTGLTVKMLLDPSNLGGNEIEIGEIKFPTSYRKSPAHRHTSMEIFYVISGKLGHEVNGQMHVIEPGMIGVVRPGDRVSHSVESDEPVRGLVVWTPAGEAERLTKALVFKPRPIEKTD